MNEDTTNWEDIADIRMKEIKELRAKLANVGCPAGMKICPLGLWKPGEEHPAEPSDTTARLNRHLDKLETTTRLIPRDTTPKSFSEDMGAIAESHHRKPIGLKKPAAPKPAADIPIGFQETRNIAHHGDAFPPKPTMPKPNEICKCGHPRSMHDVPMIDNPNAERKGRCTVSAPSECCCPEFRAKSLEKH